MSRVGFLTMKLGFRFGDANYRARLDRTGIVIEAGEEPWPDVHYAGQPKALAERLYGKRDLAELAARGVLEMTGERSTEARFMNLFSLPQKFEALSTKE
jgi:hypothetical protein